MPLSGRHGKAEGRGGLAKDAGRPSHLPQAGILPGHLSPPKESTSTEHLAGVWHGSGSSEAQAVAWLAILERRKPSRGTDGRGVPPITGTPGYPPRSVSADKILDLQGGSMLANRLTWQRGKETSGSSVEGTGKEGQKHISGRGTDTSNERRFC